MVEQQFVAVSSYSRFDNLAHGPKGQEAEFSLRTYSIDPETGKLTLLSVTTEGHNVEKSSFHANPSCAKRFIRMH